MSNHHIVLGWQDWLELFGHFLMLSMMSLGGAISTSAEMYRYLVDERGWLTATQFTEAIALAQAAPGPNVLFVPLMGWKVGLNTGSTAAAAMGVAISLAGILLPSSVVTYQVARWAHRNHARRGVRAFKQGLAPLVIGMLLATAWILAVGGGDARWPLLLLSVASGLVIWRTRIHLLWLLAAGALLGAAGVL